MSWKRASAGETVYNKCPTNATGQSCDILQLVNTLSVYLHHSFNEYICGPVWPGDLSIVKCQNYAINPKKNICIYLLHRKTA